MRLSLRRRFMPQRRRSPADEEPVLRGNMRRVLVLRPPGDMFQEAVFILRDDYLSAPGQSRRELLRQARCAAEGFMASSVPLGSGRLFPSTLSVFVLGAASAVLALWFAGLL